MGKSRKQNVTKVYCARCDLIFETRERFENHLQRHSSNIVSESCPIDTVIAKFVDLFRKKSTNNLE